MPNFERIETALEKIVVSSLILTNDLGLFWVNSSNLVPIPEFNIIAFMFPQ